MKKLFKKIYLTPKQGATTSIAAAVLEDFDDTTGAAGGVKYLQPYALPTGSRSSRRRPPYPMFEMLGPYVGYRVTTPRIPNIVSGGNDDGSTAAAAAKALFEVCEQLTGCRYPESSSTTTTVTAED